MVFILRKICHQIQKKCDRKGELILLLNFEVLQSKIKYFVGKKLRRKTSKKFYRKFSKKQRKSRRARKSRRGRR